jgi:small GTP-binding protein
VFEIPPEVWCHILHYVDEFDDIFILRRVNRLFNDELKKKKGHPLAFLKDVNIQDSLIAEFQNRHLPRNLTDAQIVEYWQRGPPILPLMERDSERNYLFKVVFYGPPHTGKSILWSSYSAGTFTPTIPNNGIDFIVKSGLQHLGVTSKLQVWDTAGQERFRNYFSPNYFRSASGVLFCFDITNRDTFIALIEKNLGDVIKRANTAHFYLVGTKADLHEHRKVSRKEAEAVARVFKMKYFEVSSKQFKNINEMFDSLCVDMLRTMEVKPDFQFSEDNSGDKSKDNSTERRCNVM